MPCAVDVMSSKVNHNGIETIPAVTYQGWEPGKEYTKNIVLKNVMVKTQKLTYNSPSSRFFSTLYPKQITLSAGTSYVLPVTFRPLEKNIYEDQIYFASKDGQFSIPIKAVLPVFNVTTPEQLTVSTCAVKDETELNFTIHNKSELVTPFQWDVQDPFTIEPSSGVLQPHGSANMTMYFRPTAALVYQCQARCLHGTNCDFISTTILNGTGKYPQLLIACSSKPYDRYTEATLDFGSTPIGTSVIKNIEIFNMAMVEAKCTIEHLASLSAIDKAFSCAATRIVVPPMSSVKVQVKYSPTSVNTSSIDYLYVNSISDIRRMTVKCVGNCSGPDVKLSADLINFSLTNLGESVTRVVEITNSSAAATYYQFKIDCRESVYKFNETAGQLAPGEMRKVIIVFCPTHAINYYRKISCVVDNQPPIFLELLGTAHSETVKPAVLEARHVTQFRVHMERGLSMFPPEQLNEMRATGKLEVDSNNTLMNTLPKLLIQELTVSGAFYTKYSDTNDDTGEQAESIEPWLNPVEAIPPMDLYFNDGFHSDIVHFQPHVSLDTIDADFGQCLDLKNIEPQIVRLTNHTKGKIIAQWTGNDTRTFFVTPNCMEIPPLKTVDFRVQFTPDGPNNFYSSELECYCYYKSTRDYRLVESLTHAPPFCVMVTALASTFQQNQQTFLPQISLSCPTVVFPATNQNEASYSTLTMVNQGSTPVIFEFPDMDTFSIKPKKGMLMSRHETFVLKALPTRTKAYKQMLNLQMNHDKKYAQEIPMACTAETAEVLLSNNGEIFFKETCVGTSSSQTYQIKNISRVPLQFRWLIKNKDQNLVKVEPDTGLILPNEFQETQRYVMKPTIIVTAQGHTKQQSAGKPRAFPVRAVGEGANATIKAEDAYIEFDNVLVGSSSSRVFNICNDGDCAVKFKLDVQQKVEGMSADQRDSEVALKLECYAGEIPARSKQTIRGVVKPLLRCPYSFEIAYCLLTPELPQKETEYQHLINAFAAGVFPLLAVTDARIHGSGIGIGKRQLWDLFQLDNLNMFLDSDPSDGELRYSVQTRNSTRKRPPIFTRAILDFNFGAAPVDSEPCYVTLHVENTGTVDCDWEFLFPSDLQMDLEGWSESAEYTQDELHEMKVMDNKLFSVSPKNGRLQAGGTCAVTLTYHHLMSGTDRVPVLLKLSRGREILMNFIGVTVETRAPYIHFPSNTHSFAPVAVGEMRCPKQVYELYNGGSVTVNFEIDCVPLELLKHENFDHCVLECLNPKGVIAPGTTYIVEWMFHPLEAKTYQVDVPIYISGGEPALITFTGVGYDKTQLGETMPTVSNNSESSVPPTQMVKVPGQTVVLSHERVSFSNLPLFSKTRKVVFMRNTSDHTISYSWHVTNAGDERIVNVSPAMGTLQPNKNQMIKVAFTSFGEPAFYDMDMICEVVDETEMARYRRRLRDWDNERVRQINEFTITERDLPLPSKSGNKKVKAEISEGSAQILRIEKSAENKDLYTTQAKETTYKSYKTLPPILDRSVDKDREEAIETERMKVAMWPKPTPPKPFLLHLGVIARTHAISTFQEQFFEEFNNFFIDKTLGQTGADSSCTEEKEAPREGSEIEVPMVSCTEAEGDMLNGVIANILRSLVDDPSFHQSVTKLTDEQTPYFNQFKRTCDNEEISDVDLVALETREASVMDTLQQPEGHEGASPITPLTKNTKKEISATAGSEVSTRRKSPKSRREEKKEAKSAQSVAQTGADVSTTAVRRAEQSVEDTITRMPSFANMVEDVLENTLMNILLEAASGEVNITARPRLIALPPRKGTPTKDQKH